VDSAAALLLDWYDRNARVLPWRVIGEGEADPYRVWLSEVMLQQTTTSAVAPFFSLFLERLPSVLALSAGYESAIRGAWAVVVCCSITSDSHTR
jgi:A/G-specific adenine glycosylase